MKRILIALLVSGMIISQTTGCGGSSKTVESSVSGECSLPKMLRFPIMRIP